MRTIKQPDDWSCMVACIQMATLRPRQEILQAIKRTDKREYKSGIDIYRFIPYLYRLKIIIGPGDLALATPTDYEYLDEINVRVIFENTIGILSVNSERFKNKLHAVFWDGQNIRDPNPNHGELSSMDSYIIQYYAPLVYLDNKLLKSIENHYHGNCG